MSTEDNSTNVNQSEGEFDMPKAEECEQPTNDQVQHELPQTGEQDTDQEIMVTDDQQESMDTSVCQPQEGGGAATPMDDSTENGHFGDEFSESDADSCADVPYDNTKIFVGGLNWETNDENLRQYFGKFGTVTEIKIKIDPITKRSRGFAFVVFDNPDSVEEVMKTKPHKIDNKEVDTKRAIPHALHQAMKNRTKKIFVGGVPTDMPEEVIKSYFIQYGEIEEVALVTEKVTKKRRGFCFVTYLSENSVDKCTEKSFHDLDGHQVEVKRATPRESTHGGHQQGGRGRSGGRGGGGGRSNWAPYGVFTGYGGYGTYQHHGGYGPYGGYSYPPPYFGGPGPYGPPGYDHGYCYGSRYGPMKQNHSGGSYHPYSR